MFCRQDAPAYHLIFVSQHTASDQAAVGEKVVHMAEELYMKTTIDQYNLYLGKIEEDTCEGILQFVKCLLQRKENGSGQLLLFLVHGIEEIGFIFCEQGAPHPLVYPACCLNVKAEGQKFVLTGGHSPAHFFRMAERGGNIARQQRHPFVANKNIAIKAELTDALPEAIPAGAKVAQPLVPELLSDAPFIFGQYILLFLIFRKIIRNVRGKEPGGYHNMQNYRFFWSPSQPNFVTTYKMVECPAI
jgi:hypothetical protein